MEARSRGSERQSQDVNLACLPFTVVDEAVHHLDTPAEPWSIQLELGLAGRLDAERLRAAVEAAVARHPMARARMLPARRTDRRYHWEITPELDLEPLRVVECPDGAAVAETRARLQSVSVPLVETPPFRMRLARHPGGDVLMMNVNHAAFDGFGALRLLNSVANAYTGRPDPTPVPLSEARAFLAHVSSDDSGVRARRRQALAGKVRDLVEPPARLVPEGATDRPGYGFEHLSLTEDQTARLAEIDSRWTVNDVMLTALVTTVHAWNRDRRRSTGRVGILVPVNLRPPDWPNDGVTNFVLDARVCVPASDGDRRAVLEAVSVEMDAIKEGGGGALAEVLRGAGRLPLWLKQSTSTLLWLAGNRLVDTALLSNLGQVAEPPDFGDSAGPVGEIWFSAPGRMPCGLSIGVATVGGRSHISFRHRWPLFGQAAAAAFARRYVEELELTVKEAS